MSPTAPVAAWEDVWSSGDALNLRVQRTITPAGPRFRVVTGNPAAGVDGMGAVTLCQRARAGRCELLFVHQTRSAIGRSLWELPRGVVDPGDASLVAAGLRELHEEAGVASQTGQLLGMLYPDSGVLGGGVAVVLTTVSDDDATADLVEVDDTAWLDEAELSRRIAAGELCDGITLAALSLWQAGRRQPG